MPPTTSARKRLQTLEGTSFRFERKGQLVFINDLPAQVHVNQQGGIELVTEAKTVRVSGATYWEMIYDELVPTKMAAGLHLAKYDELVGWFLRLGRDRNQERNEPPAISLQQS